MGSNSGNSLHSLFLSSNGGIDKCNYGFQTDLELHKHFEMANALTNLNIYSNV